jgi:hypothetical protein
MEPTIAHSDGPTSLPSTTPSQEPTISHSDSPTPLPSEVPTGTPSFSPTEVPTQLPTTPQPTVTDAPPTMTIPTGFYIVIPPDTEPEQVAWELRQGASVLESAGYGTYRDHGVHFERAYLESNQNYALILNVESGTGNGRQTALSNMTMSDFIRILISYIVSPTFCLLARAELSIYVDGDWEYLVGDRGVPFDQQFAYPRFFPFSIL